MSLCVSHVLDGDSEWKVLLVFIFFKEAEGGGGGEKEAGWEVHVHILHLETPCLSSCTAAPRPGIGTMRACVAPAGRAARTGDGGDPRSVRARLPHGSEKVQIPMAWSSQGETGSGFVQGFGCAQ